MGVLVASQRPFPPPPAPVPWPGVARSTWTADGQEPIDLLNPASHGVMLVQDGVRGLGMPPVKRYTSTSPAVHGSRWRGHQVEEREVMWPLFVWSDAGTADWLERDAALWRSFRPDVEGWWEFATSNAVRRLRCRFSDDSDHSFSADPSRRGWDLYGVRMVAEDPWWHGASVHVEWGQGSTDPFLPGPPFTIGGASDMGTATLRNPGDVPAWPVWSIPGPSAGATVGLAGRTVSVPFAIAADEVLVVDTRPSQMTAMAYSSSGAVVDRTGSLGPSTFAPVPPGTVADLSLSVDGGGPVRATLDPLYYRAWG